MYIANIYYIIVLVIIIDINHIATFYLKYALILLLYIYY